MADVARGNVARRPDGKWRARYRDKTTGKEHARHFDRKRDALDWLGEVNATAKQGIYVDPDAGKITFDDYYADWITLQVWEPNTVEIAERAAKGVPFGGKPMNKLVPRDFQSWVKDMQAAGLAESTIRTRYNYVAMGVRAAVGTLIQKDPSALARRGAGAGVRLPKPPRSNTMRIPEPAQVAAIYDAAQPHFRPFIAVCMLAGLRLGEAAGLQLGDVDFLRREIKVQRQVQGESRATLRIVAPKAGSARTIAVPPELLVILAEHLEAVGAAGDERWLFTSDFEHPFHRNTAGHRWRDACRAAGVEGFTLHDLRHFYASWLIASGCDVVTVQRALGHSAPSITLNTYSHLWPDAAERTRQAAHELARGVFADSLRTKALESGADYVS